MRTRRTRAWLASASITLRPFGPASLEMNAKVSTRPLRSVSTPAKELMAVSEPVLARSQPAGPWSVEASRKRSASVPLPPAIGSRSSSARNDGWSGPAAACTAPSSVLAVSRSSTDSPLESTSARPPVSTWAVFNRLVTASTAPAKLRGRLIAAATSRAMHSASTLSEWSIISDSRWTSGADCTTASCRAPDGAEAIVTAFGIQAQGLGQLPSGVQRRGPGPPRVDRAGLDASGVDHHRLDRRDVTVVDVGEVPALRHRRTAERRGVHLHRRRRHAAAADLLDEVADPRRSAVPGVHAGRCRRQRRIPGTHQHDGTLGVLAAGHHAGTDPGLMVQRQQCRGRREHLVGRRRHQRHVARHLPQLFSGDGVGDPAAQPAQVRVARHRCQRGRPRRVRWVSRRCRSPGRCPA